MKKTKRPEPPFEYFSNEDMIRSILIAIFVNGQLSPILLAEAIGIPLDLAIKVMSCSIATMFTQTPDEHRKEIETELKKLKQTREIMEGIDKKIGC